MLHLVIIGGSDAGISAALRARELAAETRVTLVVADRYPNFSICGLPFYLSGEIKDWRTLAHRTVDDIREHGIDLLLEHQAVAIQADRKQITVADRHGQQRQLAYDKLVVATGATSAVPDIAGTDQSGVFFLRWLQDSFAMQKYLAEKDPASALIVGAGYIGMEMADALTYRGLKVTVAEYAPTVLTTLDPDLGEMVKKVLNKHGVDVLTGIGVNEISPAGDKLIVTDSQHNRIETDTVLIAAGSRPRTDLALDAGIATGFAGAIKVNRRMETNLPDIYAAGDCVETWHHIIEKPTYLPLGTTAHKQGRVAGENALGGQRRFAGSLGTQVVKIFDQVAARTGLRDSEARQAGFEPLSIDFETWDHKVYYPDARPLHIRLTGDRRSHRLLGAQMLGSYGTEVSKRIDVFATALFHRMSIESLNDLDLSYTPPLSSPWDPVQMSAQQWMRSVKNS